MKALSEEAFRLVLLSGGAPSGDRTSHPVHGERFFPTQDGVDISHSWPESVLSACGCSFPERGGVCVHACSHLLITVLEDGRAR